MPDGLSVHASISIDAPTTSYSDAIAGEVARSGEMLLTREYKQTDQSTIRKGILDCRDTHSAVSNEPIVWC